MKILITAFDPFGGEPVNAASLALRELPESAEGWEILKLTLPTVFEKCVPEAIRAFDEHRPEAILLLGEARGRRELTPERVAINIDDARIPDNSGSMPIDRPIDPTGPAAYFSTLPVKAMTEAIRALGIPASVSNSAGTFVCNHLMYGMLNELAKRGERIPCGFMHVPTAPEAGRPEAVSMETNSASAGIMAAVRAIIDTFS